MTSKDSGVKIRKIRRSQLTAYSSRYLPCVPPLLVGWVALTWRPPSNETTLSPCTSHSCRNSIRRNAPLPPWARASS